MLESTFKSFVTFLVIMDPFASAAYFSAVSKDFDRREKREAINTATAIAGSVCLGFLLAGPWLLRVLGVGLPSFQIAGGVILFLTGLRFVVGAYFTSEGRYLGDRQTAIMIIGVPLITGPGVLTSTIILHAAYGTVATVAGAAAALAVTWAILHLAGGLLSLFGSKGLEIISRVMGIILCTIAVEYVIQGIKATF